MTGPKRPDDLTDHERWQWAEAEFCDIMVKDYRDKLLPEWLNRGHHASNIEGAYKCAISAECWERMATHLRQPYYARKEHEDTRR